MLDTRTPRSSGSRSRRRKASRTRRCHRNPRRWDTELKEYLLDWDDVRVAADPHSTAFEFGLSVIRHACMVCGWDPELAASAIGDTPPLH